MTNTLKLPWPARELNPNVKSHWAVKAGKVKKARQTACDLARVHKMQSPAGEELHIWWQFYPPDRRKRDDDNLGAMCKSYRDGIADALNINDHKFHAHYEIMDTIVKGGAVVVTLTNGSEIK